jgi:hypothetical protein
MTTKCETTTPRQIASRIVADLSPAEMRYVRADDASIVVWFCRRYGYNDLTPTQLASIHFLVRESL